MSNGVRKDRHADGAAKPVRLRLPRLLDLGERGLVVLAFAFFFEANLRSANLFNVLISLGDLIAVICVLLRRPTDDISLSPSDWAFAIIGTEGAMLARPGGHPLAGVAIPMVLWCLGLALSFAAKISLNVRFGLAPANRGVQARGVYALVRHPMYAGYLLMGLAYFLINPTTWNAAVYVIAWTFQFLRVQREESWLGRDPAYRVYAEAVRFRFIPFVV
jgi:protein-S-isoprenylcysteine O-methyltransferase Ste14